MGTTSHGMSRALEGPSAGPFLSSRGMQREVYALEVTHKSWYGQSDGCTDNAPHFDNKLYVHEFYGEVTTSSFESSLHKENNTSRAWSYAYPLM